MYNIKQCLHCAHIVELQAISIDIFEQEEGRGGDMVLILDGNSEVVEQEEERGGGMVLILDREQLQI